MDQGPSQKTSELVPFDMEYSNLGSIPEHVHPSWYLAACDATQMFLQGSADRQSLRQVYQLIGLRAQLFDRLKLSLPSIEEMRMTIELLHATEHPNN